MLAKYLTWNRRSKPVKSLRDCLSELKTIYCLIILVVLNIRIYYVLRRLPTLRQTKILYGVSHTDQWPADLVNITWSGYMEREEQCEVNTKKKQKKRRREKKYSRSRYSSFQRVKGKERGDVWRPSPDLRALAQPRNGKEKEINGQVDSLKFQKPVMSPGNKETAWVITWDIDTDLSCVWSSLTRAAA